MGEPVSMAGRCMCGVLMKDLPKNHACPEDVVIAGMRKAQQMSEQLTPLGFDEHGNIIVVREPVCLTCGYPESRHGVGASYHVFHVEGVGTPVSITGDLDFDALFYECAKVLRVKGADYTGGKGVPGSNRADRLANFYTAAKFTGLTPFQVWEIYFYKHVAAIFTFCQKGQVESEPIEGRIVDAMNYLGLLHKMILHEKELASDKG